VTDANQAAVRTGLATAIQRTVAHLRQQYTPRASLAAWLSGRAGTGAFGAKAALPDTEDYDVVRADLVNRLTNAFMEYLASDSSVRAARNDAKQAVVEDVDAAFYRGYEDAAGADAETEDDDEKWLTAAQSEQLGFMADAFESLKEWRAAGDFTESDVDDRAETWGVTLDGIYQEGKARGAGNVMLTFRRPDGAVASKKPCSDCARLDGKRHSAAWWSKRDLIRRNGNDAFECGRWEGCLHDLFLDSGDLFSES
jgi:hypothetical protein